MRIGAGWRVRIAICLGMTLVGASGRGQVVGKGGSGAAEDRSDHGVGVGGREVADVEGDAAGVPARAARLTFVEGGVTVVREDMPQGEPAVLNMALAQGMRLAASEKGQAEVEFEDGSVVRLTSNSSVRLDFLGSDSKSNVTIVQVLTGLVYCELRVSKAGRFSLMVAGEQMWPLENASVRVNLDDPPAVYSVLTGKIMVEHVARVGVAGDGASQSIEGYRTEVRAGESLRSDATNASRYFLAASVPHETWDNWNEKRDQAAANALASETPVRSGFAGAQGYGWSDLDASGTWYDQPGAGPVWQPGEALSVGFDPYGYGSWSYFPGGGYTWASAYSWGWTPYRCGRWRYWDGFGWGWEPDLFCRTQWRYGVGRANVYGGPRGYAVVRVPLKGPSGVHPIVGGPHPGERPPVVHGLREPGQRQIAGVVVAPIGSSGHGVTARGGSAVGSALRRDYAVDEKTRTPVAGVAPDPNRVVVVAPVSAGAGWRAVSARQEAPAAPAGGFHGLFGHSSHTAEAAPLRVDGRGNPYVAAPVQRTGATNAAVGTVDRGRGSAGSQAVGPINAHTQPVQQQSFHSAPSSQPAAHVEMHSSPAPSAPAMSAAPAAAASKK